MQKFMGALTKAISLLAIICFIQKCYGQNQQSPAITDFAVWGGSAASNSYNSSQSVVIGNNVTIQGNIGTNHLINAGTNLTVTGNIFSNNIVTLAGNGKIIGDIFAARQAL